MKETRLYTQAIEYLNKAKKECIEPYMTDDPSKQKALAGLKSVQKEVLKLQRSCLLKKKENDKKEKRRAQAMFGSSSNKSKKETSTGTTQNNNADNSKVVLTEKDHNGKDKNKENGTTPTPVSDETTTKKETPAPVVTTSSSLRKKSLGRRVSFREDVSFTKKTKADICGDNDDEEDDEIPWYEEHKEALILTGLGGALALAMTMLCSSRK